MKETSNSQIIASLSEESTGSLDGKHPFEERVFARFDALELSVRGLDVRLEKLEIRAFDTKPIWEQALKEIVDTRRELSKRLDRIEAVVYETRSDLRDVEDRLDKIEPKLPQ